MYKRQLKGRIYYNPETDGYEVADKFIAGNVIGKADRIEAFLRENPDHAPARESLEALREATPKPLSLIHICSSITVYVMPPPVTVVWL